MSARAAGRLPTRTHHNVEHLLGRDLAVFVLIHLQDRLLMRADRDEHAPGRRELVHERLR
jgi:hypothetical protein